MRSFMARVMTYEYTPYIHIHLKCMATAGELMDFRVEVLIEATMATMANFNSLSISLPC